MLYKNVNQIFCQPLLSRTFHSPPLSKEEENYIWEKSRDNLYSGFLNKSIVFDDFNSTLSRKLIKLSKNYQYKFFAMYEDMHLINSKLKSSSIKAIFMKGMALNLADIHTPDERHCRDIDILVPKNDINKAYEHLKSIGFSYFNTQCNDSSHFLEPMHHLPPLSNERGTIVELHHRVTSPQVYKKCPLTEIFFESSNKVKGIHIPSAQCMILHAIYHGVIHNSLGDGLIFLLDLNKILKKYKTEIDLELTERLLKIDEATLLQIKKIISNISKENIQNNEVQFLVDPLFNHKEFFCDTRKNKISANLGFVKRLKVIRYQYQISFLSIKYPIMLLRKLTKLLISF